MKLIIAGGRDFSNYDLLEREAEEMISGVQDVEIISGLARGADLLGCRFAEEKGLPLRGFAAEWGKFGRSAGIVRNKLMAKSATHLLAFWDGQSKGTMHMIDYAHDMGLKVKVIEYDK
jgi:predicted Rossmann fold nucleotide-binding protein DprA/Smf involved in DNA uptake